MRIEKETEIKRWLLKLKKAHEVYAKINHEEDPQAFRKAGRIWEAIQYIFDRLVSFGYDRDWIECTFLFGREFLDYEKKRLNQMANRTFWGYTPEQRKEIAATRGTQQSLI